MRSCALVLLAILGSVRAEMRMKQIRERAVDLAKLLGLELVGSGIPEHEFPRAAQERLMQEADRIETEEHDPVSAARFRRFLEHVPSHYLVVVPVNYTYSDASVPVMPSYVSHMTVEERDGNGSIVRKTRHCENGNCSEEVFKGKLPLLHAHKRSKRHHKPRFLLHRKPLDSFEKQDGSMEGAAFKTSLGAAIHRMADEIARAEDDFDHEDALDNEDAADHGFDDLLSGTFRSQGYGDLLSPFQWRPFELNADGNDTASQHMVSRNSSSASSFSSSTQVRVQDGKVIKVTKECKNGKCTTTKKEEKLGTMPLV